LGNINLEQSAVLPGQRLLNSGYATHAMAKGQVWGGGLIRARGGAYASNNFENGAYFGNYPVVGMRETGKLSENSRANKS
jgi:hypothetical protein